MRISDWSSDVCSSDLFAAPRTVVIGQQIDEKRDLLFLPRVNNWNYLPRALICRSIWGWSRNIMAQRPRQFWRGSIVALAAVSHVLLPALAAKPAERRVGKECARTCRSRWWTSH